jgi:hypothetical protein
MFRQNTGFNALLPRKEVKGFFALTVTRGCNPLLRQMCVSLKRTFEKATKE